MYIKYKNNFNFKGAAKRHTDNDTTGHQLAYEFKFHYSNIKEDSSNFDPDDIQCIQTTSGFIRNMNLFLSRDSKNLTNFFIEKEMIDYLLNILNIKDGSIINLQIETLKLLNRVIEIINTKTPCSIFENNEQLVIDTLKYYQSRDYEEINIQILIFFGLIYDGTEKSSNFIFSIANLDDLTSLLEKNYIKYGKHFSNLIQKFTKYRIPPDKVEYIFNLIKSILQFGERESFRSCFISLENIVNYCQYEDMEEIIQYIKELFENDEELPDHCVNNLNLDDYEIPCAIFLFIIKMCKYKFNLQNYKIIFQKAYEALDLYSIAKYPHSEDIRSYAAYTFLNVFFYDFQYNSNFLLPNSVQYTTALSKIIEDDSYQVAYPASHAFLIILYHLPSDFLKEVVYGDGFFYIMRRILDFDNIDMNQFMQATNYIFQIADNNSWLNFCIEGFGNFDIDERLEELKEDLQKVDERQTIEEFLVHFNQKRQEG